MSLDQNELLDAARKVRGYAHAPYSGFFVGVALRDDRGNTYLGCNVENSSYGLTVCAEHVALVGAVAAGAEKITALAVAGPGYAGRPTPPCGACRQVIWDLAGNVTVLLATLSGEVEVWTAAELLPAAFGPRELAPTERE